MSSTFCPLPWIHVSARSDGTARMCCHANAASGRGVLLKKDGGSFNYGRDPLLSARNSTFLKEVRLAALKSERHPGCVRCWREEDCGIPSRRQMEINGDSANYTVEQARQDTAEDGTIAEPITFSYDIRLGNLCNLKCRMCGPQESSSWYNDHVALEDSSIFEDASGEVSLRRRSGGSWYEPKGIYDWHERDALWEELDRASKSIKKIYMAGGEPLLIDRHYGFLEACVARGHAQNMMLEYNSNITVLPGRALSLWPHFKQVSIGCSIDGVGAVNNYIRHPSRFSAIESNLDKIENLGGNVCARIACSVGVLNVLGIPDLMRWKMHKHFRLINNPLGRRPLITLHPIHRPTMLSIKILPLDAKRVVADRLRSIVPWLEGFIEEHEYLHPNRERLLSEARRMMENYITLMMSEDDSHLLPRFWSFTRRLDEIRGERLENSIPELYELIRHTET